MHLLIRNMMTLVIVKCKDVISGKGFEIPVAAAFVAIGHDPNTKVCIHFFPSEGRVVICRLCFAVYLAFQRSRNG